MRGKLGVGFVQRELECQGSRAQQVRNGFDPVHLGDGRVKADVHVCLLPHLRHLVREPADFDDRVRAVVRHVYDGRDASRRGSGRGVGDSLGRRAAGVHVGVDQAGHHIAAAIVADDGRLSLYTGLEDGCDPAAPGRESATPQDSVGQNDIAAN